MSRSINIKTVTSSYEINIGNEFLKSEHMKKFAENKEVLLVCDPKIGRSKIVNKQLKIKTNYRKVLNNGRP